MLLLKILFLVMITLLASQNFSTILIHRIAIFILLFNRLYHISIYNYIFVRVFQTTLLSQSFF